MTTSLTPSDAVAIILAIAAGEQVEYERLDIPGEWKAFSGTLKEFFANVYMYNWRLKPAPPKPRSVWISYEELESLKSLDNCHVWSERKTSSYTEFREVLDT